MQIVSNPSGLDATFLCVTKDICLAIHMQTANLVKRSDITG